MSITYRCDRAKGITYEVWHGPVSAQEWEATANRQIGDAGWPGGDLYIADLGSATVSELEMSPVLEKNAKRFRDRVNSLKLAIVAPTNFSAAERYQAIVTNLGFHSIAFASLDTACLWLGLDFHTTENILREMRSELSQRTGTDG
jgi:hypothetical protein